MAIAINIPVLLMTASYIHVNSTEMSLKLYSGILNYCIIYTDHVFFSLAWYSDELSSVTWYKL